MSFGNLILLLCKTWATFCHYLVHQHGRLLAWVTTITFTSTVTQSCHTTFSVHRFQTRKTGLVQKETAQPLQWEAKYENQSTTIRVKFPPWWLDEADVSSDSPSSERIENFCGCMYIADRGYVIDGNMVKFVDSMGTGLELPHLLCEANMFSRFWGEKPVKAIENLLEIG